MMYRHLPTTKELLNAIKVKKASAASKTWIWIAMWIAVAGLFFVLPCFGLRYLKWFEKDTFNWAALIPLVVMIAAAFTMAMLSIIKDGIFQNPAKRMASEIDAESEVELQFMQTFGRISTPALLDRYQRIEEQLAGREKWLSVVRWLGVISAAFIVLSGELGLSANISSGIKNFYVCIVIRFRGRRDFGP